MKKNKIGNRAAEGFLFIKCNSKHRDLKSTSHKKILQLDFDHTGHYFRLWGVQKRLSELLPQ